MKLVNIFGLDTGISKLNQVLWLAKPSASTPVKIVIPV